MKRIWRCLLVVAIFATPIVLLAQLTEREGKEEGKGGSHSPPKVIQIFREQVKGGQAAAHQKFETQFVKAMQQAKFPYYSLALANMTGANEAWFLNGGESYADIGRANELIEKNPMLRTTFERLISEDATYVSNSMGMLATYQPNLSYRPEVDFGKARFVELTQIQVKPGYGDEYKDIRKMISDAHAKHNHDEHIAVYQVQYGAPTATYLIFQFHNDMGALDQVEKMHDDAYMKSLGDDFQKKLMTFARDGVVYRERNVFSISPKMSYMSPTVVASAPEFWNAKPEMQAASKKMRVPKTEAKEAKQPTQEARQ